MKVTVRGNKTEQIKLGIEPCEKMEVEIDLKALSPEQRELLATEPDLIGVEGTQDELIRLLQDVLNQDAAEKARQLEEWQEEEKRLMALYAAAADLAKTDVTEEGINYLRWSAYYLDSPSYHHPRKDELNVARETARTRLSAEADRRNAEILAEMQPKIEAARAERKAKEAAAEAEKKAALKAKFAKRLETGILEVEITRGDRREWGEPWIAKVQKGNGKTNYDFGDGEYDAATETIRIPCQPGDVIAWGQKNYHKAKRTIHEVRKMRADGGLDVV